MKGGKARGCEAERLRRGGVLLTLPSLIRRD
jgi:hypothetical protein